MDNATKGIREFYDATANQWAEKWYADETMMPLLRKFISLFRTMPRILDAGCGAGYESMRLTRLGATVTGIDISKNSIQIARDKNPDCRFEVLDCLHLDESLGKFDGIAAIALLVHMRDDELQQVFDNFKKVINPEGFLFTVFVEGNGFSENGSYVDINGERYNRAFYLHPVDRIIEKTRSAGFEFVDEWFLPEQDGWKYLLYQSK